MIDLRAALDEHARAIAELARLLPQIQALASDMVKCLANGGKVIWFGNSGSAADSLHLAAEQVGRYKRERKGLASFALTTDSSVLTAIGNDYGFDQVFARQVEASASGI